MQKLEESERRNQGLLKELEYQKLRADALDKLIEVGERELKISIRKKFGSKLVNEFIVSYPTAGIEKLCRVFGVSRSAFYKAEEKTGHDNLNGPPF